jgi:hypothetical protein
MSAREALALAQGYWSGASTTGQNTTAAQTLYGMSQGNGSRWRKNRSGGGLGNGNMSRGNSTFYNGNNNGMMRRRRGGGVSHGNRGRGNTTRYNRKNRKGTRKSRR